LIGAFWGPILPAREGRHNLHPAVKARHQGSPRLPPTPTAITKCVENGTSPPMQHIAPSHPTPWRSLPPHAISTTSTRWPPPSAHGACRIPHHGRTPSINASRHRRRTPSIMTLLREPLDLHVNDQNQPPWCRSLAKADGDFTYAMELVGTLCQGGGGYPVTNDTNSRTSCRQPPCRRSLSGNDRFGRLESPPPPNA
jgi:hypothetical protein